MGLFGRRQVPTRQEEQEAAWLLGPRDEGQDLLPVADWFSSPRPQDFIAPPPGGGYSTTTDPAKVAQLQAALDGGADADKIATMALNLGFNIPTAKIKRLVDWRNANPERIKRGERARFLPARTGEWQAPEQGTLMTFRPEELPFKERMAYRAGELGRALGHDAPDAYRLGADVERTLNFASALPFIGGAMGVKEGSEKVERGDIGSGVTDMLFGSTDFVPAVGPVGRAVGRAGSDSVAKAIEATGPRGLAATVNRGDGPKVARVYSTWGLEERLGGPSRRRAGSIAGGSSAPRAGRLIAPQTGPFGPIHADLAGDWKAAVARLAADKTGEVPGAAYHPDIGDIALVWGKEGTGKSDGYGLAKLLRYHPEVIDDLPNRLLQMQVTKRSPRRIRLGGAAGEAAISLEWFGKKRTWLLTAYDPRVRKP